MEYDSAAGVEAPEATDAARRIDPLELPRATLCTEPFARFLASYYSVLDFLYWLNSLTDFADVARLTTAEILAEFGDEAAKARYEYVNTDKHQAKRMLKRFGVQISANMTTTTVNAFQRYFSELIQCVAIKKPDILRSSQTIRIEEVLNFTRHRDIVTYLIDRKVNEISYGGLREMEAHFKDRLGVDMFDAESSRAMMTLFVECRNTIVHNGGIVDDYFLRKAGPEGSLFKKGQQCHLNFDRFNQLSANAIRISLAIDAAVSKKFRLVRRPYSKWKCAETVIPDWPLE